MDLGIVGQAVGLFAVTNIDDLVVLALFFAQGADHRGSARRVVLGQYLGFAAILAVAVAAAFGATFLPETALPTSGCCRSHSGSRPPGGRGGTAVTAARRKRTSGPGRAVPARWRSPPSRSPTAATTSASTCRCSPRPAPAG